MLTEEFNYNLPEGFIANKPAVPRDHSRLMILDRDSRSITHKHFYDLPNLLSEDYVIVLNKSKVIPARILFGAGGNHEILLLKNISGGLWNALVKPGRIFKIGASFQITDSLKANVREILEDGTRMIEFEGNLDLNKVGQAPFPPYIKDSPAKLSDYQTIYAKDDGSIAAPTAGLHFTEEVFERLKAKGIGVEFVTLHVGLGTFQPVKVDKVEDHDMHYEVFELKKNVAERLNEAKARGKKILAVGTTSVRVLESSVKEGKLVPGVSETNLFVYPGYKFQFVDSMVTNFHLPKSTLLMLISAFAEKDFIFKAYEEAIREKYRFYSFGDAMLIL